MLGQKSEEIKARTKTTALKDSDHLPSQYFHVPDSPTNSDTELETLTIQFPMALPNSTNRPVQWKKVLYG